MEENKIKFQEFLLSPNIQRALDECGYEYATPIQAQTIPNILEGRDVIGQSQTGTGKTASYALPIIEGIDATLNKVQAIVLCPTRELAMQVTEEIRKFTKYQEAVKCLAIYGGEPIDRQIKSLKRDVKIVIGTPGRVMDHMRRKTLKLDDVKMVVLDEADEMLNMGFEEDIETILKDIPEERQTVLFSATLNPRILNIAKKYLKNPISVKIKTKELTVLKIEQIAIEIKQAMKDEALTRLIDINNPQKAVVFCNTKRKVDDLIEVLKKKGYKAESLHGDIKQAQREKIMKRFKSGEFQILVATDVVARGIDVDNLELVINYDVPQEEEYYVHRIGRTGRNGKEGKAYTFIVGKEKSKMFNIQRYANTKLVMGKIPTQKEIYQIKTKNMLEKIQKVIEEQKNAEKQENEELLEMLLENNSAEEVAKALLSFVTQKNEVVKEETKQVEGMGKVFLNVGKKDNIMVKDIVGSISANTVVSGNEIGKINILDKFSFIEIPAQYIEEVIQQMEGKQIKGRDVRMQIANS